MANLAIASILLSAFVLTGSVKRSSTYFEKSGSEDLETSASGYSYQIQSGSPFEYKSFIELEENVDDFEHPQIRLGRYSDHPIPLHLLTLTPEYGSEYDPTSFGSNGDTLFPYAKGFDNFLDDLHKDVSSPNHYGSKSTNFVKGAGSNYEDVEKAIRGEKGERGYSNRDEFAKGLKGKHDSALEKDFYDVLGGNRRAHQDMGGRYAASHQAGKGAKGGSFSEESSHDKGSKTTGYHKVFHKDEYKKDHSFYDKADKKGHFNRYGNFDTKAAAEAGKFAKGRNLDAGFREGKYGLKGLSNKGHYLDEANGYRGAEGDGKYYKNGAVYANRAGKSSGQTGGFGEKGDYADEK